MNNKLDVDFKKFINECDREQENLDIYKLKQQEIDADKRIDEEYFKFVIPITNDRQ